MILRKGLRETGKIAATSLKISFWAGGPWWVVIRAVTKLEYTSTARHSLDICTEERWPWVAGEVAANPNQRC